MATANTSNIQLVHQHFWREMRRPSKPAFLNLFLPQQRFWSLLSSPAPPTIG